MWVTVLRWSFWAGVVALSIVSVTPREHLPTISLDVWDKLQHVIAYGMLSGLGAQAYTAKKNLVHLFLGLVALGGVLEVIQQFVPNREAEFGDAIANAVGVGIGLVAIDLVGRAVLMVRRN